MRTAIAREHIAYRQRFDLNWEVWFDLMPRESGFNLDQEVESSLAPVDEDPPHGVIAPHYLGSVLFEAPSNRLEKRRTHLRGDIRAIMIKALFSLAERGSSLGGHR